MRVWAARKRAREARRRAGETGRSDWALRVGLLTVWARLGGRLGWVEGEELGPGKEAGRLGREVAAGWCGFWVSCFGFGLG